MEEDAECSDVVAGFPARAKEGEEKTCRFCRHRSDISEGSRGDAGQVDLRSSDMAGEGRKRERLLAQMEAIFASVRSGLILYDLDGNVVRMNERARKYFAPYESLPLEGWLQRLRPRNAEGELIPPEELPLTRALRGETAEDETLLLTMEGGAEISFSCNAAPVRDPQGEIFGAVVDFHEITERLTVEKKLRDQEERHRELLREFLALFDGIADPIMALDGDLQVLWGNAAAAKEWGVRPGQSCFSQLYGRQEPCVDCPARTSIRTGRVGESLVTGRDGRLWGAKSFPVTDDAGTVVKVIHMASDITEKVRAREQSLRESRLASLGELAAGIAHEINNPNALILINAPVVADALNDALQILDTRFAEQGDFLLGKMPFSRMRAVLPQFLDDLIDASKKIRRIVEDLKDFVRDDGAPRGEAYDLNGACEAAVRLLQNKIRTSTDRFETQFGADLPLLCGNLQRMEQVVVNLLMNACQALTDRAQGVVLRTWHDRERGRLCVEVRDEGVGIAPENMGCILDPFFTTKRELGGTGLGLSVSMSILKEVQGTLEFESTLGLGTVARVCLPCEGVEP